MAFRNYLGIANDVVHTVRARCSGITQVIHLNRRHALRKYSRTTTIRKTLQINRNIDFVGP